MNNDDIINESFKPSAKEIAKEYYNLIPSLSSVDLMYLLDKEDNLENKPSLRTVVYWLSEFNKNLPKDLRGSRNRVKADRIRKKALLDYVSLQRYRDNLHAEQFAKEFLEDFQESDRKRAEKRKEIAKSFYATLRIGLDPLAKVEMSMRGNEIRLKKDTDN